MFDMGKRPAGVTLIVAALLALASVGLVGAGSALLHLPPPPVIPCEGKLCAFDWRLVVVILASIESGLSAWALVTGIGLLGRLRWARKSVMVLASVPFLIGILAASHGMGVFVGLGFASTGTPLLWYFGRPEVTAWFDGTTPKNHAAG